MNANRFSVLMATAAIAQLSVLAPAWALDSGKASPVAPARDRDVYAFPARKGQTLSFVVESRTLGTPLDPVLRITDAAGLDGAKEGQPHRSGRRLDQDHERVDLVLQDRRR